MRRDFVSENSPNLAWRRPAINAAWTAISSMLRLQGPRKCPAGSASRDIQEPAAVDEALAPLRRQVEESGMTDVSVRDSQGHARATPAC